MRAGLATRGQIDPRRIDRARERLRSRAQFDQLQASLDRLQGQADRVGAIDVLVLRRDGSVGRLITRGSGLLDDSWWPTPLRRWPVRATRFGEWVRVRSADGKTDEVGMIIERYKGGASGTEG